MKVKLFTLTNENQEVWIDALIDEKKINGFWIIPSYIDEELDLIVDSDELNVILNGNVITVKKDINLIEILKLQLE